MTRQGTPNEDRRVRVHPYRVPDTGYWGSLRVLSLCSDCELDCRGRQGYHDGSASRLRQSLGTGPGPYRGREGGAAAEINSEIPGAGRPAVAIRRRRIRISTAFLAG